MFDHFIMGMDKDGNSHGMGLAKGCKDSDQEDSDNERL